MNATTDSSPAVNSTLPDPDQFDPWTRAFCNVSDTFLDRIVRHQPIPYLSICFQDTVLVWIPCFLMWIFALFYLLLLRFETGTVVDQCKKIRRSWLNITKMVVGALLSLLAIVEIIIVAVMASDGERNSAMSAAAIRLITMLIATALIAWEFRKAVFSSGFLFTFWLIYAVCYSVLVYTYATFHEQFYEFHKLYVRVRLASYSLVLLQLVLSCIRDGSILMVIRHRAAQPNDADVQARKDSPGLYAGFCSRIFFAWAIPSMFRGWKKGTAYDELCDVWPTEMSHHLLPRFDAILSKDKSQRKASRKYFCALLKAVGFRVIKGGLLRLLTIVLLFINLIVFRELVTFIKDRSEVGHPVWLGYFLACVLLVVTWVRGLVVVRWLYDSDLVGMHLRSIITATVYRKILRLSNSCVVENMDIGFVVNLMSADSLRLSLTCRSLHEIITLPIYLCLAALFLYDTIRWAALIGMLVMVTIVPFVTAVVAVKNKKFQDKQMDAKDQRLKVMSEVLAGIKVIKLYAWELVFERRVTEIRKEELRNIQLSACLNAVGNVACLITPYLVSVVMFASYAYLRHPEKEASDYPNWLDPGHAFVTLSLICLVNYNISSLPSSVQYVIQGFIALKRAASLMEQDEVQTNDNHLLPVVRGPAVAIEHGNFSWTGPDKPVLEDINIQIAPGQLVAVVGGVGTGKSSLLSCLLREMKTTTAQITISDSVAYLPQQAWILNGTVKDNVCFQKPYVQKRFQKVVEACALGPDIEMLPGREMTEIGSKGANLSGGQKQRVSLARAVYTYSDTYLIDDSLSAVDPNVGQHIFSKAFGPRGLLRKKTRIFATNSYGFLPEVDRILVIKDGRIVEDGKYEELRKHGKEFCRLISQPLLNEEQKKFGSFRSSAKQISRRTSTLDVLRASFSRRESIDRHSLTGSDVDGATIDSEFALSGDYMTADDDDDGETTSTDKDHDNGETHRIHVTEESGTGFVKWHVVGTFIKAGGLALFLLAMFGLCVFIGVQAAANVWLRDWTDQKYSKNSTKRRTEVDRNVLIYGIYGIIQLLAVIVNYTALAFGFLRASRNLHSKALYRLFRARISFFDTNPPGRILNYISADMDTVDASLPLDIVLWLVSVSFLVSAVVTIGVAHPIFLAVILPIIAINILLQRVYGANAIPLKRFYSLRKSPVYSHFEESIVGAASIRAYRQQQHFIDKCDRLTDESNRPWCSYIACWRLYTCYNEIVGAIAVFLTATTAVALSDSEHQLTAGGIGLALFSVFQVLPHIPIASRMTVEIEANIVAVERIKEYSNDPKVPMEAVWEVANYKPPPSWPEKGVVKFEDYDTRYREGLEMVLSQLSFQINSQEKVGIVGRTGAGKSSIILSLFRMMEAANGRIVIDGEDISYMGLHDLRSRLTTIPQDPILFSGTLRSNLDPLAKHSDKEIWMALEQSHLKSFVATQMEDGLDEQVSNGDEISVGQRQLLCMARALLRNSKIIILDEATSGIDPLTDELIQKTIREQFKGSTVITIAHRLSTIMDYNRVMVLDHGRLMELGPPRQLIAQTNSIFASMAKETQKTFGDDMPVDPSSHQDHSAIQSGLSDLDDVTDM